MGAIAIPNLETDAPLGKTTVSGNEMFGHLPPQKTPLDRVELNLTKIILCRVG